MGDFDGDGVLDMYRTDLGGNILLLGTAGGSTTRVTSSNDATAAIGGYPRIPQHTAVADFNEGAIARALSGLPGVHTERSAVSCTAEVA